MPNIIPIHGPVAVGKSTLTSILREKLPSYSYVDRPYLKRGLKAAGKENALKISKEASYFIIRQLVELKQDIIVQEVNPESMKRKIGEDFFRQNRYKIISFYIKCSVKNAIERDELRDAKTVGKERIEEIHDEYSEPADYEIVIDTDKLSIEESAKLMLSKIL